MNLITLENVGTLTDQEIKIILESEKVKQQIWDIFTQNVEGSIKKYGNYRENCPMKHPTETVSLWNGKDYDTVYVEITTNKEWDIKQYSKSIWADLRGKWEETFTRKEVKLPEYLIGEQLFNKEAVTRLWLWDTLPANEWAVQAMIDAQPWENDEEKYANFFKKYIENKFVLSGAWNKYSFEGVDSGLYCWLGDGSCVRFWKNDCTFWDWYDWYFSICNFWEDKDQRGK